MESVLIVCIIAGCLFLVFYAGHQRQTRSIGTQTDRANVRHVQRRRELSNLTLQQLREYARGLKLEFSAQTWKVHVVELIIHAELGEHEGVERSRLGR